MIFFLFLKGPDRSEKQDTENSWLDSKIQRFFNWENHEESFAFQMAAAQIFRTSIEKASGFI